MYRCIKLKKTNGDKKYAFHLAVFLSTMLLSTSIFAQCGTDTSLFFNSSFEEQSCCPTTGGMTSCITNWEAANSTPEYFHYCDYMGNGSFRPPGGFPDGLGGVGLWTFAPVWNEMLQTCTTFDLDTSLFYVFSGYVGFQAGSSINPFTLGLFGAFDNCLNIPAFDGYCPLAPDWELITEITYSFAGDSGWIFGQSDCFKPNLPFNRFLIGSSSCGATDNGYNYVDLVELRTCQDMLNVEVVLGAGCISGGGGSIDLTVSGGVMPYLYDWDIDGVGDFDDEQDLTNVDPGLYGVTITDQNGLLRCMSILVLPDNPDVPTFDPISSICQFDPAPMLEESSTNDPPMTGTWSPDTIMTDVPGVFSFTFTPDSSFCADIFMRNIRILRRSTMPGEVAYVGCAGDGHQEIVNGQVYNESNPTGQEIFNTMTICDSVVNVNLSYLAHSTGTFSHVTCTQSGYAIEINSTIYDEDNPTGVEVLVNANNCDSMLTIELDFLPTTSTDINEIYCMGSGESVLVNGTVYDEGNPLGSETMIAANGCDSVIDIDLFYFPTEINSINYQGCSGDGYFVMVNGTIYDELNTEGTENMENVLGCDSIVFINLIFSVSYFFNETYQGCLGDGYTVLVNGVTYDESNPMGLEVIPGPSGCDTVITIDLGFNDEIIMPEEYTGCLGDGYSVVVNDVIYDEANPTGQEIIASAGGCDSIINIDLIFNAEIIMPEEYTGCQGDGYSVVVNDVIYDETNPTGQEIIMSAGGCDSIINIDLDFTEEIIRPEEYTGCQGDGYSVVVNDVTYDESNPTGQEIITSSGGCDSIINIDLAFNAEIIRPEEYVGCLGDGYSVVVNDVIYDEANPVGQEIIRSSGGCDSIINIDLAFNAEIIRPEEYVGCLGDGYSVVVNDVIYDESNPVGQEVIISAGGCDSIINIDLVFNAEIIRPEEYTGCQGDGYSVVVNDVIYNESNPVGQEIIMSAGGCDSIINIDLEFTDEITRPEEYIGCQGDGYSVVVNDVIYDEMNPTGQEIIMSAGGCDSIINIDLNFNAEIIRPEEYTGCQGDGYSIVVNDVIYDEMNPTGQEIIMSASGCDSIININLNFTEEIIRPEEYTGCQGDGYSVVVNDVIYDETNPTGQEIMMSAGGCDSIVDINLEFTDQVEIEESYFGCANDGYEISVNGTIYNELNPSGQEFLMSSTGCDTVIMINLEFQVIHNFVQEEQVTSQPYAIDISQYLLQVDTVIQISWVPSAFLSCSDCVNPLFTGDENMEYQITFIDQNGCEGQGVVRLLVNVRDNIYIPNVFSPNNDGVNDRFEVLTKEGSELDLISFEIFNRWGGRVFYREQVLSNERLSSWDGTYKGSDVAEGVYVYQIRLFSGTQEYFLFGDITLVR